jgi:hypothetical protein
VKTKADAKLALRDRARVVLWGVALIGAVQAVGAYLAQRHAAAVMLQLVAAEFGTGRLGVAWSDPLAPLQSGSALARRALRGAAFGGAAAVVLIGASVMVRAAQLGIGMFGVAPIVVGLVTSAAAGARDELMLRGLVLRALGPRSSFGARLGVCALAGAAFRFGVDPAVTWPALAFAAFSSAALAALWIHDRGAWVAVGANSAFAFAIGTLAYGTLLDVRGPRTLDASPVAVVCAALFAASAVALARRKDASAQTG